LKLSRALALAVSTDSPFDIDSFLAQPLTARLATGGPTIRPVWFVWEKETFWTLTGRWSKLSEVIEKDPKVALLVDTCDLATGKTLQVQARGSMEFAKFDRPRCQRFLAKYLGPDSNLWEPNFRQYMEEPEEAQEKRWLVLRPSRMWARDVSFTGSWRSPPDSSS
jgi:hypothetical protein